MEFQRWVIITPWHSVIQDMNYFGPILVGAQYIQLQAVQPIYLLEISILKAFYYKQLLEQPLQHVVKASPMDYP